MAGVDSLSPIGTVFETLDRTWPPTAAEMASELLAWRQRGGPAAAVELVELVELVPVEAVEAVPVEIDAHQGQHRARGGGRRARAGARSTSTPIVADEGQHAHQGRRGISLQGRSTLTRASTCPRRRPSCPGWCSSTSTPIVAKRRANGPVSCRKVAPG